MDNRSNLLLRSCNNKSPRQIQHLSNRGSSPQQRQHLHTCLLHLRIRHTSQNVVVQLAIRAVRASTSHGSFSGAAVGIRIRTQGLVGSVVLGLVMSWIWMWIDWLIFFYFYLYLFLNWKEGEHSVQKLLHNIGIFFYRTCTLFLVGC